MNDLRYTKSHEWVRDNGDGTVTLGITAFAQDQLGDVVFWECSALGESVAEGDTIGTVESVKAVSDVYAPLAGEVLETNEALEDSPDLINADPTGEGWMIKMKLDDASALEGLMDAAAYQAHTDAS